MTINGPEDGELKIKGLKNMTVGEWRSLIMQSEDNEAAEATPLYGEARAQRARDRAAAKRKVVNSVRVEVEVEEMREERVRTEAEVVYNAMQKRRRCEVCRGN